MNRTIRLGTAAFLLLLTVQVAPAFAQVSGPPSQAASVLLTIIPPRLPADGGVYPAAVISLVDSQGLPTAAVKNLTFFLTSSQTNIASVPDTVTIRAGEEYTIANVTTTNTPGTALITAHAQGLASSPEVSVSKPLATVTPSGFPSKLLVLTSPSNFPQGGGSGQVRVEVVDAAGLPTKAIGDIPLQLSASISPFASLAQTSLTIPAGSISVDGAFTTLQVGSALIAATSSGYTTGDALVTVSLPNGPSIASKLSLRVIAPGSPGVLPTDGLTYAAIEVGLETSSGSPITATSDIFVQLTSDNPSVASVPTLVMIPSGSISALAMVTTSALAGVANVTATYTGLVPATVPVETVVPAPSKLQTYVAPASSAYFPNGNSPILVVQLQDSSGNPARARQDTNVVVTSSNGTLLSSFVSLGIPKGSDYVFSYLHPKGSGLTTLTASSQDLISSQSVLTVVPSPLVMTVFPLSPLISTSPNAIFENQTLTVAFSATLDGVSVTDLNVTWGSSGGMLTPQTGNTSTGSTYTVFSPDSPGNYNITARASSPTTGQLTVIYPVFVEAVPKKPAPTLVQQILGYWYYIVAAVAAVVVAVVYLYRMRRKKARAEIEAGFEVV